MAPSDAKRLLGAATPLPWKAWLRNNEEPIISENYRQTTAIGKEGAGSHGEAHGLFTATGISRRDRDDAALIVYAVNRLPDYEAAVEALKRVVEWEIEVPPPARKDWDEARAALRRLRGEVPAPDQLKEA